MFDKNIAGILELNSVLGNSKQLLTIDIDSLPISLSVMDTHNILFPDKLLKAKLTGQSTPIDMFSPFIPSITNLSGLFNTEVIVSGYLPDKIKLDGYVSLQNCSFVLDANNLQYMANGLISLNAQNISIDTITVTNNKKDDPKGKAIILGSIQHDYFDIKYFDLTILSERLKVLSNATMKVMPSLYGNMTITTGKNPLHFYGSFTKAFIKGDLNILNADLYMPDIMSAQASESKALYINKNNSRRKFDYLSDVDSLNKNTRYKRIEAKNNSLDFLNIDLNIRFLNRFVTKMDIAKIGMLTAEIGTQKINEPVRLLIEGNKQPQLFGDIILKEDSKFVLIKTFNTKGKISFPTGSLDNPGIDLTAEYKSRSYYNNVPREISLRIYITGTKNMPLLRIEYSIDNNTTTGDISTLSQDATYLLMLGKTKAELSGQGTSQGFPTNDITNSLVSTLTSQSITNVFGNSGVINNVDVDMSTGSLSNANLKISGQVYLPLFGPVIWRLGGNVSDFTSNNEISIDFPLPVLLDPWLNNNLFQLTRTLNSSAPTNRNQKDWEFKLKLGGSIK